MSTIMKTEVNGNERKNSILIFCDRYDKKTSEKDIL